MKHYSHEFIVSSLKQLEVNNFNYNLTSKMTNVCRKTLVHWKDKMGKQVFSPDPLTTIALNTVNEIAENRKQLFIINSFGAKEEALARIRELIPKERNILSLMSVIKDIHELDKEVKNIENEASVTNTINYVNLISQNIKLIKEGNEHEIN